MNLFMLVEITRPDYYEEKEPVGIFDSHEGALVAQEQLTHDRLFSNWFDLTVWDKRTELYNAESSELNQECADLNANKPIFDQTRKSDRIYVDEHTTKIQRWRSKLSDINIRMRARGLSCLARAEDYAKITCIGEIPEYVGENKVSSWREIPTYEIEEFELNILKYGAL